MECGRGAGEIWARYGRDAGEARLRARARSQTRSRRESPAALPLRRRAGGESTRSAKPKQHERRGFKWRGPARPLAHGKDLRAKRKRGRGQPRTKRAPRSATEARPCCLLWPTFATTWGGARRSRPGGWGRPRPRAPPRAAPTRRPSSAIRTTAVGRAESAMSVAQEGSRGERRAACLRRAHNVSELGELGEAAARHRGHGLDDVAHHAPGRPVPAVVLDSERDEPPDWKREGVPGG